MNVDTLKKILWLLVLTLVQVLVLNHVHLFGVATPLLYIYFIIIFQRNYPRWALLLWGFALGLLIDIFSNTPGVTCGSLTVMAFIQPYLLRPFISRDSAEDMQPGIKTLHAVPFCYYSFLCVLIFCVVFYTLEMFSFFNIVYWLECVGGSTLLTYLLILVIENVRRSA
ncbi:MULTISPECIES: rod shape-determining protein MreD [Prevotella]|jgi:rod shape-determining protein MreD|uniref:Rod shape-determining protein MreD n=1 Tax=Prevotella lacticifex TaxID=2854755 RepID=A0A9R1CBB3_9BACT|nr:MULTISPECIES: rod shape-determining protein MreD [Prevotella]MDD6854343.1 rod shape-determining protein MreD [Prevotella sp.]GJG36145.1 rod shape-determining protein MreD [Prevotella lacticifex]GJG38804.1 rod shape-determining protein MreD [Prevotella lacticifex]GJG42514.1 rod shape-determining protein MreD [Prevotella lacticifex]GJG45160.1 rod shape-determining protein MreD [Prevotella lacticifex]